MKANYLKRSLWLAGIVFPTLCATAQTKTTPKTAYNDNVHTTDYRINNDGGRRTESIRTEYEGKFYRVEMVNEKMTSLSVDGEKVPETDWNKYSDAIRVIREEIKAQIKRNEEQAKRNQEQAVRNQEQARINGEQAKRNAEQNVRNEEQATRNEEQAKKNAEQAVRNQEQVKKNEAQAVRNQDQEKRNAEQATRNQEQAKRNEEQARVNEQFIKDITGDLIGDKIIPDTAGLHQFSFNSEGMTVNGVKLSDEVFKKYKAKYSRISDGNFNYSRDGVIRGQ